MTACEVGLRDTPSCVTTLSSQTGEIKTLTAGNEVTQVTLTRFVCCSEAKTPSYLTHMSALYDRLTSVSERC